MVSPFIYAAIRKRAKNENVAIPKNLTQILRKYQLIKHSSKYKIVFWWAHDPFATVLNGSPMMPSAVILNHVWASRVVLHDNAKTMNAFRISVGHELAHKEQEFKTRGYHDSELQFIYHITEVRADFYSAKVMCGSKRAALISSIEYKKDYKENEAHQEDIGRKTHPSWSQRKFYATYFDFNSDLIKQIAKDNGCNGSDVENKMLQFYIDKSIYLDPRPKPLPRKIAVKSSQTT